jgi:hypothetical protein
MPSEGAAGRADEWEEDTDPALPETVRMPTARPCPQPSGPFEVAGPVFGVLVDGVVYAPELALTVPGPAEVLSQGVYRRTWTT